MSARKSLTDRTLKSLAPAKPGERYEVYDTQLPAFGARVSADVDRLTGKAGRIAFILYARFGGSPGRRRLGFYRGGSPALTLAEAREKAKLWLALIEQGKDPAVVEAHKAEEEKRQEQLKQQHGFAAVAEQFIALKVSRERCATATAREIKVFVDAWGAKPITEITRRDVRNIIEPRVTDAPYMARNLLATVRRLFVWAVRSERYGLDTSPCSSLQPQDLNIADKEARDRALNDDEIRAFWRATQRMRYPAKQVYQLLALLGLRKSEVANAAWSEFHPELRRLLQEESKHPISWQTVDPRWKTWIIPAKRMKGKNSKARDHAVPLSVTALRVLETLPMFDDDYLFSVRRGRPAVNYQSSKRRVDRLMTDELRDMARRRGDNPNAVQLKEWRIHDLRRTVRSGLSQLRIPREVAEAVLAHVAPGIVGTYDVHDYLDQKADALQKWSAVLASIVEPKPAPNNVTALRRA